MAMENEKLFVELEASQWTKTGQAACGDDFRCVRIPNEKRTIAVLSDGLGSGIKANLMASMTSTMALEFVRSNMDILQSAETIMDSLPVCEIRKISYATFTVFDMQLGGKTRVIEMDNPPFIHLRNLIDLPKNNVKELVSERWPDRKMKITEVTMAPGDRLIAFSDGVTQAGLGCPGWKFGWRREGALNFIKRVVEKNPEISARDLATMIAAEAMAVHPERKCKDDITCMVLYLRHPRVLRVITGPPFRKETDREYANMAVFPEGKVVLCGGTTANIVSRELRTRVDIALKMVSRSGNLPPPGFMRGVGLVTEGILTLTQVAADLESGNWQNSAAAAKEIVNLMMDSDIVEFIVGTKINEAHQDPMLPVDLEMRRNVIKRLKAVLENNYRKNVSIRYF